MKFRIKIMLCTTLLLALTFGFGGSLLIQLSFNSMLKQEKNSALESYRMISHTLKTINQMNNRFIREEIADVLTQLKKQRVLNNSYLRLMQGQEVLFSNTEQNFLFPDLQMNQAESKAFIFQAADGREYYQISGPIAYGDATLTMQGVYPLSQVYDARQTQLKNYHYIFLLVLSSGAVLSYVLAALLTRPLHQLSEASRKLANGERNARANVKTKDEIGALAEDFNHMAQQLSDKITELEDIIKQQELFMGSFAHELKTPMTSIIGYADLLRMQNMSEEEKLDAYQYIYSEGKRLQSLSFKLLNLFVTQENEWVRQPVSLRSLLEGAASSVRNKLEEQKIELSICCPDITLEAEPDLMKSLFINLIDNARKAIDQCGHIEIQARQTKQNMIIIEIKDDGCGMPDAELKHITEAFYRIDKSRSRAQGGAGLGLTLCNEIVRMHDGVLSFKSQERKGTCATIYLKEESLKCIN